jgi:MFS family permease
LVRIGGALFFLFRNVLRGVPLKTLSPFTFSSEICSLDMSQEQQLQIPSKEVIANSPLTNRMGPVNTLLLSLILSALSMLVLWPVSNTLGPLIAFVIINGAANGGFFSTMPTVVGNVFGSRRVGVAMGMIVSGWAGGYLMVSTIFIFIPTDIGDEKAILTPSQGSPIAGYLLAAYGGEHSTLKAYHPAMIYAGSMALGASLLVGAVKFMLNKSLLKKL